MSVPYSLDDVARMSDDGAVRARFDAAVLTALRFFSFAFMIIGLAHLGHAKRDAHTVFALTGLLAAVVIFFLTGKKAANRAAQFVRQRARGTAIVFLLLEAGATVIYHADADSKGAVVLSVLIALGAIFFRLLPSEHILLHAALTAISVLALTALASKQPRAAHFAPAPIAVNAVALAMAMYVSRRYRRSTIAEWTERRASAREQIRMRDELLYAREMQLSMLPECAPSLPWADICSISIPATEVGGDYYDYFVGPDSVALVCGDVAGHGMASGLVLSAVRGGFALLHDSLSNPGAVLRRLHDVVTHTTRRRMLVTISLVLVDRTRRKATIASAGHPPAVVRRADGSVTTIELFAPPLGVRLPVSIPQREIDFAEGDAIVLHSDGIYETRNAADEVYGLDRLQRVVYERRGESAEALRNAILSDLANFRGASEQDDDVTIVVCRMTG